MSSFLGQDYDPSQFIIDADPQPSTTWITNDGGSLSSEDIANEIANWNSAQYNLQYNYIFELADTIELASRGSQYSYTTTATEYLCVPASWFSVNNQQAEYDEYEVPQILYTKYAQGA